MSGEDLFCVECSGDRITRGVPPECDEFSALSGSAVGWGVGAARWGLWIDGEGRSRGSIGV